MSLNPPTDEPTNATTSSSDSGAGSRPNDPTIDAGEALLEELGEVDDDGQGDASTNANSTGEPRLEDMPWHELVDLALDGLDGYLAARPALADCRITDTERKALNKTTSAMLEKYAGASIGIEGACAVAWGSFLITRWLVLRADAKANAPRDVEAEPPVETHNPDEPHERDPI